jgi:ADP-ribosyl-[dinitrogen reductase] hydrolase
LRFWHFDRVAPEAAARAQSVTTHRAAAAVDSWAFFTHLLIEAIEGKPKEEVLRGRSWASDENVDRISRGSWHTKSRTKIKSSGYVIDTLEAAVWSVAQSSSFREAVLTAGNLGDDADTVAAVTGQLAGAIWGERGIPEDWCAKLAWRDHIRERASRLFELGKAQAG